MSADQYVKARGGPKDFTIFNNLPPSSLHAFPRFELSGISR